MTSISATVPPNETLNASALESVDRASQRLNYMIILTLVALISWSASAPLDIVSMSQGTVTPSSKVQRIQHLQGGIVRNILVKEGDAVKKDQPLINLESTANSADYGEVAARVRALTAEMARLDAEVEQRDEIRLTPEFIAENQILVERTKALLKARRDAMKGQFAAQKDEIKQRQQDIEEISARQRNSQSRLSLVEEQLAIDEKLRTQDLSNRYDQIERLKEANLLRSRIEEDKAALARAKAAVEKANTNLASIKTEYAKEVQTLRADTRRQLEESEERLQKYQDNLKRTILRAPMDGVIKALYVTTEGGVVSAGEVVMDLVPLDDALVIEAQLPPQDIGHVHVGQRTFIQLASGEAAKLGQIEGKVVHVSADTMVTKEGAAYYVVRIATEKDYFGKDDFRYPLKPGVMVQAGIVTGERSVLGYLMSPLTSSVPFALSER